ncbi:Nova1 [Symbiodinium sp. CCMP2456]|nr:Nova1 [Symbiodinium sp. CCMP2456]
MRFAWPPELPTRPAAPRAPRAQGSEWTARVVLNVHAAGLLIGRGGKRIKMLQEDSGAQMQFFQGTDAPKGFGEEDRLVELRGPPVELQDGLELLLSELARVPEALAPRCAQLLVPEDFKEECCEEALKFGATRATLGAALGDGERLLALEGDTAAVRGTAAVAVTAMLCRRLWKPGQPPPSYRRREALRSDSEPRPALPSPLFASAEKAAQLIPWSLGKPRVRRDDGAQNCPGSPPRQKEDSSLPKFPTKPTVAEDFDHLFFVRRLVPISPGFDSKIWIARPEALEGLAHMLTDAAKLLIPDMLTGKPIVRGEF